MKRGVLAGVVVLAVLALVAELLAVPVSERMVGRALARCLSHESVHITAVDRPVVPRLLLGRATGVRMEATGLVVGGELRVEEAELDVPLVILPWAIGSPEPEPAALDLLILEGDLEAYLRDDLPFGLRPVIRLSPGVARLGVDPLPVRVEVAVSIEGREVRIAPTGDPPDWWDRLPLPGSFQLPDDVSLESLQIRDGAVATTLVVDELPGVDGARECQGSLA